jgi:type II secretory pathway pseudopilin PulG
MPKPRRQERIALTADLTIQPGGADSTQFPSQLFNVSRNGLAAFSKGYFPPGKLVKIEAFLPVAEGLCHPAVLYGVIRHAECDSGGNVLGIELLTDDRAGDYHWFAKYMDKRLARPASRLRGAFTLMETCIALSIICIMVVMAAPIYQRAMEQARVDSAGTSLRTIWSAQRVYWLEYRAFAPNLSVLSSKDLVDSALVNTQGSPTAPFVYRINQASADSFTAAALRNSSGVWTGQIQINQDGAVSGNIIGPGGLALSPPP